MRITLVFNALDLDWNFEKSLSSDRKADHSSSFFLGSAGGVCNFSIAFGSGTLSVLSVDVRGVDRLSRELRGKELVDEFAEDMLVMVISTLAGFGFLFKNLLVGLSDVFEVVDFSSMGTVRDLLLGLDFKLEPFAPSSF